VQDADFLFIVAEVAVGLAGFASIVAAIGQRNTSDDPRIDASRLRGLLECSLVVVAFSLLPYAFHRVLSTETAAWRVSSLLFAATATLLTVGMLRRRRNLSGLGVPVRVMVMVVGLYSAPLVPLLLVAIGVLSAEAYLFCLLSYLVAAGIAFLRVMLSFLGAFRT
jgi:hypothetical protein